MFIEDVYVKPVAIPQVFHLLLSSPSLFPLNVWASVKLDVTTLASTFKNVLAAMMASCLCF